MKDFILAVENVPNRAHCRSSFNSIDNRCGCYSVFYHQIEAGIFKKITEGNI